MANNQKEFYEEAIDNLETVLQNIGGKLNDLVKQGKTNPDDSAEIAAFVQLAVQAHSLLALREYFLKLQTEKKPKAWPIPKG